MSAREFSAWCEYYRLYPFDDYHRHHRPAALIAHAMGGGDINARLDWLQPPAAESDFSAADVNTLRAFGIRKG